VVPVKRLIGIGLAAAAALLLVTARGGGASDHYRVDAVFSNAAGLIPGQNVEIAGAVVGSVKDIVLTPQHRARVEMDVQTGFAPFHADATCAIKPQSLIGEKFVECDPGSPDAAQLRGSTVPLARTSAPVDIDLIFAALREPYVQRLSLVVNELGTGLAGRPHDLQVAIKRANPALQEFDRVLRIVNRDRTQLGRVIDRSDTVLSQLAPHDRDVTRFIDRAGAATADVAAHRDALGKALDEFPPLLDQLDPAATSLAGAAADARPVVHELSAATPQLRALLAQLEPLTSAGRPALRALRTASDEGLKAVAAARPVAQRLRPAAALIPHVADLGAQLTASLRTNGSVKALEQFGWLGASSMARFDAISHIIPSYQIAGVCNQYATTPVAGCSAHWSSFKAGATTASTKRVHRRRHHRHRRRHAHARIPAPSAPSGTAPRQPQPSKPLLPIPQLPDLPQLPPLPKLPTGQQRLLDYLLK
jgi:virulence factor Mce-like protein